MTIIISFKLFKMNHLTESIQMSLTEESCS